MRGEIKEGGEGDAGTSATTSDTEVARNPHKPEGWRRDGIDFFVAPPPRCTDIASSSLRELDVVALATNVMVFLGRDTSEGAMPLTKRQKEILDYVSEFLDRHGYSPTLEEIASHFQLASLNGVYKHLKALQERGFIRRLTNQARSIQLLNPETPSPTTLPLLGYVTAGQPLEAVVSAGEISVPESFLTRGKNYVLRVRGDSMIDEHIQDGDYVVIEQREDAHNGDMVIALIDGENATLKKFYREDGKIRLQPANPALEPIRVREDRMRIQGVVVGIMRKYS